MGNTKKTAREISSSTTVILILLCTGCGSGDAIPALRQPALATGENLMLLPDWRTRIVQGSLDEVFVRIADREPSFAGLRISAEGNPVVFTTDVTRASQLAEALTPELDRIREESSDNEQFRRFHIHNAQYISVNYSFPQLAEWYAAASEVLALTTDYTVGDKNESRNMIVF